MAVGRALVLGGGGVAGIAWHTGLLYGLAEAGLDLSGADLVVGTSAGATVAAQLGNGRTLEEWYRRQVDPAFQNRELRPTGMSVAELADLMMTLYQEVPDPAERRLRIAAMALAADTVAEPVRRAVVAGRLSGLTWPERPVTLTAVDAATGRRRVFDKTSGVVAASSAVPGIWPPVTIDGERYLDGGIFSSCNADLATGYERVVVLAPMADPELGTQVAALVGDATVEVVAPDAASMAAFGTDPLDPEVRTPVATAGRAQGINSADMLRAVWTI